MGLLKADRGEQTTVAVWKTEEDASFFMNAFSAEVLSQFNLAQISNVSKQLEFLSSRYLLQTIIGADSMQLFRKAESGMPYLENSNNFISISHTIEHSAVIVSNTGLCGIDIEAVHPRVQKIAHKFMNDTERELLKADDDIERIMLLWSAKETVYKLYGNKKVDFKEEILLNDLSFTSPQSGILNGTLVKDAHKIELEVKFEFFDGQVLTYATL